MNQEVTSQMMRDAKGRLVPISTIKDIDLLRDRLVRELTAEAKHLSYQLAKVREKLCRELDAFLALSAEQYNVGHGGAKGNVTLTSFDGRLKLTRQISDHLEFDERLQVAKQLIDECVVEWSAEANARVQALVQYAFQVDKSGKISTERVLGLRRLKIDDPKWLQAMQAISDSIQVTGATSYLRFYERLDENAPWTPISLDIVNARPGPEPVP
jgi:hypothetical protein